MKKKTRDNIKTALLLIPLIIVTRMIDTLPWWIFVIPVLALGVALTLKKWEISSFSVGWLSGFIIWIGANLYFDQMLYGDILTKIGLLLSVPKMIVLLVSGIIGGLLTGLALYTGKAAVYKRESYL
jgi:hypothetical protein